MNKKRSRFSEFLEIEIVGLELPKSHNFKLNGINNRAFMRTSTPLFDNPKLLSLSKFEHLVFVGLYHLAHHRGNARLKLSIGELNAWLMTSKSLLAACQVLEKAGLIFLLKSVESLESVESLKSVTSLPLAKAKGVVVVEEESCSKNLNEKETVTTPHLLQLFSLWNSTAQLKGGALTQCKVFNDERKAKARKVLKIYPDLALWQDLAKHISEDPFCLGRNQRGWRANFDYFIKPKTMLRFIESKETLANHSPIQQHTTPTPGPDIARLIQDVAAFFHQITHKHMSTNDIKATGLIRDWAMKGAKLEHFKHVIRVKSLQWRDDPKMAMFLTPHTIFGAKFEQYLSEPFVDTVSMVTGEEPIGGANGYKLNETI